ncbi:MAG TPA: AI-2E family transporter [Terriglobales bacterium]
MDIFDQRTIRILNTCLLFAVVLGFIYAARSTLIAFTFAIFFAYLLEPVVDYLQRFLKTRGRSITAVYCALLVAVTIFFFLVGPKVVDQGRKLSNALPSLSERIGSGELVQQVGAQRGWSYERRIQLQQALAKYRGVITDYAERAGKRVAELATNIWWLILIPILALFFLKDGKTFGNALVQIADRGPNQDLVRRLLADVNLMLGAYIRAQLILAALSVVVYTVVLEIMGVQYALALGPAAGILEFIPVVGPLLGAACILLIAFLTNYPHLLLLALFFGVWRLLQDYVNSPRIMGKELELHPLAAIFGVLAGGEIGGVVGVFLSIPLMATLRIVWRNVRLRSGHHVAQL